MIPRVWRQLLAEAVTGQERYVRSDAVLRIALVTMALDPQSALTAEQRQWIRTDLSQRTSDFTAQERARLKGPLLAYIKARMPRCEAIILQQFSQGDPDGHDDDGSPRKP